MGLTVLCRVVEYHQSLGSRFRGFRTDLGKCIGRYGAKGMGEPIQSHSVIDRKNLEKRSFRGVHMQHGQVPAGASVAMVRGVVAATYLDQGLGSATELVEKYMQANALAVVLAEGLGSSSSS